MLLLFSLFFNLNFFHSFLCCLLQFSLEIIISLLGCVLQPRKSHMTTNLKGEAGIQCAPA